jgi:hypothetical protein
MEREIKIGGATFVVADPHGAMARAQAEAVKTEQAPVEAAKTAREEAAPYAYFMRPTTAAPFNVEANAQLVEGAARGKGRPWALGFAWAATAFAAYPCALMMFHARDHAVGVTVGVAILLGHTVFFLDAAGAMQLRRAKKAPASTGAPRINP